MCWVPPRHRLITFLFFAGLTIASGCQRAEESSGDSASSASTKEEGTKEVAGGNPSGPLTNTPKGFLKSVFARYRGATSYRDQGRVRLTHVVDGQKASRTAPMQIWLNRGELDLSVYDVRITVEKSRLMAWVHDPLTNHLDSQVLTDTGIGDRSTLSRALADPILAGRISAGLAGPPPQLEWLFEAQPMESLFQSNFQFRFLGDRTIHGKLCRGVEAVAPSAPNSPARPQQRGDGLSRYRFWVENKTSIIRQVDLPTITIPAALPADPASSPSRLELQMDFVGASFDPPTLRHTREGFPRTPKFVRQFVPLPPSQPPAHWGTVPSRFQISDTRQTTNLSSQGHDRRLAIVMQYDGDRRSAESLATLEHWMRQTPGLFARSAHALVLVDDPRRIPQQSVSLFAIDTQQKVGNALGLVTTHTDNHQNTSTSLGGSFVMINHNGVIMWSQSHLAPDNLAAVAAIANDVIDGVDVPARLRQQWNDQVSRYHQTIRENSVSFESAR